MMCGVRAKKAAANLDLLISVTDQLNNSQLKRQFDILKKNTNAIRYFLDESRRGAGLRTTIVLRSDDGQRLTYGDPKDRKVLATVWVPAGFHFRRLAVSTQGSPVMKIMRTTARALEVNWRCISLELDWTFRVPSISRRWALRRRRLQYLGHTEGLAQANRAALMEIYTAFRTDSWATKSQLPLPFGVGAKLSIALVGLAVFILPLVHRARFLEEFRAELAELGQTQRIIYALRQLAYSVSLRKTLTQKASSRLLRRGIAEK